MVKGEERPVRGPRRPSGSERVVAGILREAKEFQRLMLALDRVGVDPPTLPDANEAFARFATFEHMLINALAVADPDAFSPDDEFGTAMQDLTRHGPRRCEALLDALPAALAERVRRAMREVVVNEAEIWADAQAVRVRAELEHEQPPSSADELQLAREIFAEPLPDERDERPMRRDSRPLPSDARVEAWLRLLRPAWLRFTACMYGISSEGSKRELVAAVAAAQRSPEIFRTVLRRCLDTRARALLGCVALAGALNPEDLGDDSVAAFSMPWDWEGILPSSPGVLRAMALIFLGEVRGTCVVAMPAELQDRLLESLEEADPEALETARSIYGAAALRTYPDPSRPDVEHAAWAGAAADAFRALETEAGRVPDPVRAAVFQGIPGDERYEPGLLDHHVLDRKRRFPRGALGKRVRALAKEFLAARVSVYRVQDVDWPRGATVADLFRGGEAQFVHDRALSVVPQGSLTTARVFRAGPFFFWRRAGAWFNGPTDSVQALLAERFHEFAKIRGAIDRDEFLRECAPGLIRLPHPLSPEPW